MEGQRKAWVWSIGHLRSLFFFFCGFYVHMKFQDVFVFAVVFGIWVGLACLDGRIGVWKAFDTTQNVPRKDLLHDYQLMIHMFYDHLWQDQYKSVVEHRWEFVENDRWPKIAHFLYYNPLPSLLSLLP
jgi:hypothetical protein